jgi:hypothetical protein
MKRVTVVFFLAGLVMLGAFRFAGWYADNSAIPRYCDNPQATIGYVREILNSTSPAGDGKRRPYLIAAKLIFLEPRQAAEPEQVYLDRLLDRITATCGQAY